jgi:hypothetical protein
MPFKNKFNHEEWRRNRVETNRAWVRYLKESNPCTDCGRYYPYYIMEFDHLRDKRYSISTMMCHSAENIQKEIDKCELVCGNCHAIREYNRGYKTNKLWWSRRKRDALDCGPS